MDSFNFSSKNLEALFTNTEKYNIETVKSVDTFKPKRWLETFGKSLSSNIIEAKILHTYTGLTLAIKRYASSPDRQTLEFAGLHKHSNESELLNELLNDIWEHIQSDRLARVDIAIDFINRTVPLKTVRELKKHRRIFHYVNTTYLKTKKEKKSNPRINILFYPKHKKDNLDYELERLEFSFRGGYFNKCLVKDLDKMFEKMKKTIKRLAGIDVEIQPL